jgi:hypothetical protein
MRTWRGWTNPTWAQLHLVTDEEGLLPLLDDEQRSLLFDDWISFWSQIDQLARSQLNRCSDLPPSTVFPLVVLLIVVSGSIPYVPLRWVLFMACLAYAVLDLRGVVTKQASMLHLVHEYDQKWNALGIHLEYRRLVDVHQCAGVYERHFVYVFCTQPTGSSSEPTTRDGHVSTVDVV